jgi:hypothetical protein
MYIQLMKSSPLLPPEALILGGSLSDGEFGFEVKSSTV